MCSSPPPEPSTGSRISPTISRPGSSSTGGRAASGRRRRRPRPRRRDRSPAAMLFMVVETFRSQDATSVYRRAREKGRLMPDGLGFVGSWVSADLGRCFQLMECDDVTLLQRWVAAWSDLVEFEIVP